MRRARNGRRSRRRYRINFAPRMEAARFTRWNVSQSSVLIDKRKQPAGRQWRPSESFRSFPFPFLHPVQSRQAPLKGQPVQIIAFGVGKKLPVSIACQTRSIVRFVRSTQVPAGRNLLIALWLSGVYQGPRTGAWLQWTSGCTCLIDKRKQPAGRHSAAERVV